MSTLVLVRHAQASFLARDYDHLSELGIEQARELGAYLARAQLRVDEVWVGPRRRQIDTCRIAGEVLRAAGGEWPEPRPMPALDEYRAEDMMKHVVPELGLRDPEVRELALAFSSASERRARARSFELLFQAVTRRWVRGEIDAPGVESWREFCARVHGGLRELTAERGGGRRVLAFTSAGTIGASLPVALGDALGAVAALELGWVVKNASLTEYLFSAGRVTLSSFNAVPHLHEQRLWTYR